jgi:hypothetical protein
MARLDDINTEIMAGLSGEAKENFRRGLRAFGMVDPTVSPTISPTVSPTVSPTAKNELADAFKRAHPEWTDAQAEIAARGW